MKRRVVLHEINHYLVEAKGSEMPIGKEEKEAYGYARAFLNKSF